MPAASIALIEALRLTLMGVAARLRQGVLALGPGDQMDVIGHQAVAQDAQPSRRLEFSREKENEEMKKRRITEEKIIEVLKQLEAGRKVAELSPAEKVTEPFGEKVTKPFLDGAPFGSNSSPPWVAGLRLAAHGPGRRGRVANDDNIGNVLSQTITRGGTAIGTQSYSYDGVNRLDLASEGATWTRDYAYDAFGNHSLAGSSLSFSSTNNRITAYRAYRGHP